MLAVSGLSTQLWRVGDRAHPALLGTLPGSDAAFGAGGRWVATGGTAGVRLTDLTDPAHPRLFGAPLPDSGGFGQIIQGLQILQVSPDNRLLLVSTPEGEDITVRLWNVVDPAHPRLIDTVASNRKVPAVAFLPGDAAARVTATNPVPGVQLWDDTDPRHVTPLKPPLLPDKVVNGMAAAGRLLAVSSNSGVYLFDVTDPRNPVPTGPPLPQVPAIPNGSALAYLMASSLALDPDGQDLAVVTLYGGIQLWDVSDPAHPVPVGDPIRGSAAAFTTGLLATSDGSNVRLWDLDPARTIPRICAATVGVLTPANWAAKVGHSIPYRPTCPPAS
jgi:WD40 repeat protein